MRRRRNFRDFQSRSEPETLTKTRFWCGNNVVNQKKNPPAAGRLYTTCIHNFVMHRRAACTHPTRVHQNHNCHGIVHIFTHGESPEILLKTCFWTGTMILNSKIFRRRRAICGTQCLQPSILITATCSMHKTTRHGHVAYRSFCQQYKHHLDMHKQYLLASTRFLYRKFNS